jgi:hypothetical protein
MSKAELFSPSYATARQRFREAAKAAGASLEELLLEARGPNDEPLTVDVAWLGDARPRGVLLHSSGLHGVEGFAGSAIQLQLLAARPSLPEGMAAVFLHVVNPYGMAWLRRFNENNVDLNRNFLAADQEFRGAAEAYRKLNGLLNPATPPHALDLFLPRAVYCIARYGFQNLKQAVAEGQYEFPQGLFFGGRQREQAAALVLAWSRRRLAAVEEVFAIDVHTGLGAKGQDTLLTHHDANSPNGQELRRRFGGLMQSWHSSGVAYSIRGGFLEALERELAAAAVNSVCQEFGTYKPLWVLYALREENRWHHWGDPRQLNHPAKRRLIEAFCPADPVWRTRVVERGEAVFHRALAMLAEPNRAERATG